MLPEENKVDVQRHIIENLELSSSKKTHRLNRAEKAIEKKDSRLNELESQVSNHQREIQEKELEIVKLKEQLDILFHSLGEARKKSQNSQVNGVLFCITYIAIIIRNRLVHIVTITTPITLPIYFFAST